MGREHSYRGSQQNKKKNLHKNEEGSYTLTDKFKQQFLKDLDKIKQQGNHKPAPLNTQEFEEDDDED